MSLYTILYHSGLQFSVTFLYGFHFENEIIETDRPVNHCSQKVVKQSNKNDAIFLILATRLILVWLLAIFIAVLIMLLCFSAEKNILTTISVSDITRTEERHKHL